MTEHKDHAAMNIPPSVLASLHILAAFVLHRVFPLYLPFAYIFPLIAGLFVILGLALAFATVPELMKAHTTINPHGSVAIVVMSGP